MDPTITPLRDFSMPDPNAIPCSIMKPPIGANNFQFNLAFITLYQQDQFGGYPMENPNTYITSFLEKCDTMR